MTIRLTTRLAMVAALALMTAACGGAVEDIANQQLEDAGVSVDLDEGSVTVENADGTTTTAGTGLPDGFPEGFPLPDGAVAGGSVTNAGGFALTASFNAPGSTVEEVGAFYESALPDAGYEIAETTGGSGNIVHVLADGGQVAINPAIEGQDVLIAISLVE